MFHVFAGVGIENAEQISLSKFPSVNPILETIFTILFDWPLMGKQRLGQGNMSSERGVCVRVQGFMEFMEGSLG